MTTPDNSAISSANAWHRGSIPRGALYCAIIASLLVVIFQGFLYFADSTGSDAANALPFWTVLIIAVAMVIFVYPISFAIFGAIYFISYRIRPKSDALAPALGFVTTALLCWFFYEQQYESSVSYELPQRAKILASILIGGISTLFFHLGYKQMGRYKTVAKKKDILSSEIDGVFARHNISRYASSGIVQILLLQFVVVVLAAAYSFYQASNFNLSETVQHLSTDYETGLGFALVYLCAFFGALYLATLLLKTGLRMVGKTVPASRVAALLVWAATPFAIFHCFNLALFSNTFIAQTEVFNALSSADLLEHYDAFETRSMIALVVSSFSAVVFVWAIFRAGRILNNCADMPVTKVCASFLPGFALAAAVGFLLSSTHSGAPLMLAGMLFGFSVVDLKFPGVF